MNIYEIKSGAYSAKINLSRGANCISLRNSKYSAKILREPDYSGSLDNPYLYGMPILFPVNRISNARFVFEDREYAFPVNESATGCYLHGVLHEQEFQMIESGTDYVICSYRADKDNPYVGYMQEFEITISYYLSENGLEQKTEIINLSDINMPIMVGYHTTFNIPFIENQNVDNLRIYADVTDYVERNMDTYLPNGKISTGDEVTVKLQQEMFKPCEKKISRHYKIGNSGKMCIFDVNNNIQILYENSKNMKFRLIYNGNADSYICLEPQNCMIDCLNSVLDYEYTGFEYAKPGEKKTYISKISIIGGC